MLACLIYTYLSVGEKADPEIKNICADLRSKDHFFASSDALFRESLKKIFPEVAQYVVCIRKEEIESGVPTLEVLKSRYNNFLYFKRVLAIVTDEGGVLSHASVISRELNIPCLVGTKIATQIFKDGDEVEVDANNGLVRKIS